jgi:putative membrane protein insertion efficiency factor
MPDQSVAAVYDRRSGPTALTERRYSPLLALPARAASGLIWIYQRTVSPALSALNPTFGCRFSPTCSHYAREALHAHGFFFGFYLTLRRLAKCGPWHPGGEDAVPPRSTPVCTRVSAL